MSVKVSLSEVVKDRKGSTLIEFALVAPLLTLFLIAIVEFGTIMFASILMESGLRDASRFGITGREITGQSRLEAIENIISERTIGLIDMSRARIDILVYPAFTDVGAGEDFIDGNVNGVYDVGETYVDSNANGVWDPDIGVAGAGGSGDVVLYRIEYDWPYLTPYALQLLGQGDALQIQASIAVRNEPWGDGT